MPRFFISNVRGSRLYVKGSPPVTSSDLAGSAAAFTARSSTGMSWCGYGRHEPLVSHQGQPMVQPAMRMKNVGLPVWKPSPCMV